MRHKNSRRFDWHVMADPGSTGSAFAFLLAAYQPYAERLFCVDEIYETNPEHTSVGRLIPILFEKMLTYHAPLSAWSCYYDSAAAWFPINFNERFEDSGIIWMPVEKKAGDKEENINVINELIEVRDLILSTRCGNAVWEIENYKRDAKGRIPKRHDHQIDNLRYLVKHSGIIVNKNRGKEEPPPPRVRPSAKNNKRYVSYEEDHRSSRGLLGKILEKYGEYEE